MKRLFILGFIFVAILAFSPIRGEAHMGENISDGGISVQEYTDIEDAMIKMMSGKELSDSEAEQMFEFMKDHDDLNSVYMPMMRGSFGDKYGMPGMFYGGFGATYWLGVITMLVWLFVGILLSMFLLKKLNK